MSQFTPQVRQQPGRPRRDAQYDGAGGEPAAVGMDHDVVRARFQPGDLSVRLKFDATGACQRDVRGAGAADVEDSAVRLEHPDHVVFNAPLGPAPQDFGCVQFL